MPERDPKEVRFLHLVTASRAQSQGEAIFVAVPTADGSVRISHPALPDGHILADDMEEIISLAQRRRIDIVGYLPDGGRQFKIRTNGCADV